MPEADRAAFITFTKKLIESLNPATAMEQQLAQSIAHDSWRLNRMRAIEDNVLAIGQTDLNSDHPEIQTAITMASVYIKDSNKFQLLTLYIQRTNREIHRNMQLLRQLQAERRAQRLAALEEASRLKQLGDQNNIPCPPDAYPGMRAVITGDSSQIGFEFSSDDLDTYNIHKSLRKSPAPRPFDPLVPYSNAA
jgi:hypothetical protein